MAVEFTPDTDPNILFHTVGVALTRWENLEQWLASLQSIFQGHPYEIAALRQFGGENRTTGARIAALKRGASTYFAANPNDALRQRALQICADAKMLSSIRHKIAHGAVGSLMAYLGGPTAVLAWGLFAPHYAYSSLREPNETLAYGSAQIRDFIFRFDELANGAAVLANDLSPIPR